MKRARLIVCLVFVMLVALQPASFAQSAKKTPPKGVTFDFVDVDITVVAKFISDITGKNFIFDDRVKGTITIIAPSKISIDDAFSLFTSVLKLKGFTLVPAGVDAYKIVPSSEARQSGLEVSLARTTVNESYIARLIPLKNISSEDALKFIQPVVATDGYISSFGPGNLLLVVDSGLNIEKILGIVKTIDVPSVSEEPEAVFLEYSGAEAVAAILNEGQNRTQFGKPMPDRPMAVADRRLNAVVLFGKKSERDAMKRLIAILDVPAQSAQGAMNVYFLENADAVELADTLQRLMAAAFKKTGREQEAQGVSITPDKATNSLIIIAPPADYQDILKVVQQLDKRRRQVYVEAMIVEASMDKLLQLGTKWRAMARHEGEPMVVGGFGTIDNSAMLSILQGLSGGSAGGLGNFLDVPVTQADGTVTTLTIPGYAVLFSHSEFKDAVNVLSTPQILTSDNKEAEILVGENVPFISKRERDTTTTGTVLNSIERKDVGITLRITPHITEGDYVTLDLYQEISAVQDTPPGVDATELLTSVGPTTTKRSTKTSVSVKDAQTVVIGGLMQERDEKTITKVPILGDIPILNILFRHKATGKKKTNLLVFLTPRIVDDSVDLEEITKEKKKDFAKSEGQFAEGQCLVEFNPGVTPQHAEEILNERDATILNKFENLGLYHIRLKEGVSVKEGLKDFRSIPEVKSAEPDYQMKLQ